MFVKRLLYYSQLGGSIILNKLLFLHGLLTFFREGKHLSDLIKSWRGRAPHQRGAGIFCQLKGLPPNIRQLKFTFRNKGNRTLVGFPWEDKRETHWFKQSAPRIRVGNKTDNAQSSTLTPSKERLSQRQSSQQAGLLKGGGKGAVTVTISTSELGLLQHIVDLQAWPLAWKAFLSLSLAPLAFFLPPILESGFSSFPMCWLVASLWAPTSHAP